MYYSITSIMEIISDKRKVSKEAIYNIVKESLLISYEYDFGTRRNAVVEIDKDENIFLFTEKEVVEFVEDDNFEINIDDARKFDSAYKVFDKLLIEIKPFKLSRVAINLAKRYITRQLRSFEKNSRYLEYKDKVGQVVSGRVSKITSRFILVNLGSCEGILRKEHQSPRESYIIGDDIKVVVHNVNYDEKYLNISLSRTSIKLIEYLLKKEVPEVMDGIVEIKNIVREPGYRTKVVLFSNTIDVVGASIGIRGIRIQAIIKEIEGEKVDIIKYDSNIKYFITNAIKPVEPEHIIITNEYNKNCTVVVKEEDIPFVVGKSGRNSFLLKRLTGWSLFFKLKDTLTFEEKQAMKSNDASNLFDKKSSDATKSVFVDNSSDFTEELDHSISLDKAESVDKDTKTDIIPDFESETEDNDDADVSVMEVSGLDQYIKNLLYKSGITTLADLVSMKHDDLMNINGFNDKTVNMLEAWIKNNIEIQGTDEGEDYIYQCPYCSCDVQKSFSKCLGCGNKLNFE